MKHSGFILEEAGIYKLSIITNDHHNIIFGFPVFYTGSPDKYNDIQILSCLQMWMMIMKTMKKQRRVIMI